MVLILFFLFLCASGFTTMIIGIIEPLDPGKYSPYAVSASFIGLVGFITTLSLYENGHWLELVVH